MVNFVLDKTILIPAVWLCARLI